MKLQLSHSGNDSYFTSYGDGYVAVSGERYEHHLLLMPGRAVERWSVASFETLASGDFAALLALKPDVVVLGTGAALRFPHPSITGPLTAAGVGIEVMDTRAACRTYNVLLSEDRKVLAAILVA
ncbi:MAG TPA: Mth938-like domain-containing protein [Burkholderiales bacterium]|nr:Mth938-like domain-containing protein [Burkholderiales bacterium]